jgi:hypothetical protein
MDLNERREVLSGWVIYGGLSFLTRMYIHTAKHSYAPSIDNSTYLQTCCRISSSRESNLSRQWITSTGSEIKNSAIVNPAGGGHWFVMR